MIDAIQFTSAKPLLAKDIPVVDVALVRCYFILSYQSSYLPCLVFCFPLFC